MACLIIVYIDYGRLEKEYQLESSATVATVDEVFAKNGFKNIAPGFVYLNKSKGNIDENKFDLEMMFGEIEWLSKALISAESFDLGRRTDITNIIKKISHHLYLQKKLYACR
jgi:virulence-associated protein VapD